MIDRVARVRTATAIRAYMDEEMKAFQFDDVLSHISDATKDETVKAIGFSLYFHYDDVDNHKIVASKEEWDYFNRLLLLLESDGELEYINSRTIWHPRQAVAAVFLGIFCVLAVYTGFGEHLLLYAIPFGFVSMVLSWWGDHVRRRRYTADRVITPFPSVNSIIAVRRRVPGFRKRQYPKKISRRRIRGWLSATAIRLNGGVLWLIFAPLVLLFQMLPECDCDTVIKMPEKIGESDDRGV
jgi:hypothetical protein